MVVSGHEALSGEWVRNMVRIGEASWRPLHILLLCSLSCMQAALMKASELEQVYGTQSAFGMSSRWLLMSTGDDSLLDLLQVRNITMDNVAFQQQQQQQKKKKKKKNNHNNNKFHYSRH
nr:hypothetical protein BaRGS_023897 [Batillaria attramentaria]